MTTLLEQAFSAASKLPELEQNALARWVLTEIEADRRWDELFAESEDFLEMLADEALEEERMGKTTELDFDRL